MDAIVTEDMTRRDFLHLAASGVVVAGLGGEGIEHAPIDKPQLAALQGLPMLDGPIDYELAIYRVNGVVRNMDAWYAAFDVKPGDALYLPPGQRVRIW